MVNQKRPALIVIAGPNGSGKTTLTESLLHHPWLEGAHYINPDKIAREQFGDWNSQKAILLAAKEAERQREGCLMRGESFSYETVFSTSRHLKLIKRAKTAGFFIRLYFVCTDSPRINVERIAKRVRHGGHNVPDEKVVKRYARSLANLPAALRIVDRGYVWDNSIDNQPQRPIFRTREGVIVKVYQEHIPSWCSAIIKSMETTSGYPKTRPEP